MGKGVYREAEYWNNEAVKKFWKLKALTFRFPGVTKTHKGSERQPPEASLRAFSVVSLDAALSPWTQPGQHPQTNTHILLGPIPHCTRPLHRPVYLRHQTL